MSNLFLLGESGRRLWSGLGPFSALWGALVATAACADGQGFCSACLQLQASRFDPFYDQDKFANRGVSSHKIAVNVKTLETT